MKRNDRREFLRHCAAGLCAMSPLARAAPCAPSPTEGLHDPRRMLAYLEDPRSPQGSRLDELRGRLAAHGIGTRRVRLDLAVIDVDDAAAVRCTMERLSAGAPLAFCTASARVAASVLPHTGPSPLVFAVAGDPVADGLVDAMGPRRVNATGFTHDTPVPIDFKCFELIAEAFPTVRRVHVLADEAWASRPGRAQDLRRVRERLGVEILPLQPARPSDATAELERLALGPREACYLPHGEALLHDLEGLVALLQRRRVPHLFGDERAVAMGAMLSYAPRRLAHWDAMASMLRLVAEGRPAREIPVQRPVEFLLSLGLAQWQRLGMAAPGALLRRAHVAA